jgi:hypothetical protein
LSVDFRPVFIIGDHRSGTTVLYKALAATRAFNVVTAYHVIRDRDMVANFNAGREGEARGALAAEFERLGLTDRGIDGMPVTPDLPEEYGWVIDKAARPRLGPSTLPALVHLCRRIRLTGGDRPVLLKNPWDVLNFAFVKASFPHARLIFVHRHPLSVMSSQLAATRALLAARNAYLALLSPWYDRLFQRPVALGLARALSGRPGARIVARHVRKVTRYYLDHVAAIPRADCIELRYEDLCAAPQTTLDRVLAALDCRPAPGGAFTDLIRPRRPAVLPEVLDRYRRVRPALAAYCSRHGYETEEPV